MNIVKPIKFYPISETIGYAVEKTEKAYRVVFVEKTADGFIEKGAARSRGKSHVYPSVFKADWAIRREILPLYTAVAA